MANLTIKWNGDYLIRQVRARVADAVIKAGRECAEDAKRFAPVDTGALRDSIRSVADPARLAVVVSADVPYATIQEFGGGHVPPHPYLRPALEIAAQKLAPLIQRAANGEKI